MKKSYIFLIFCVLSNFFVQILFDKVAKSISGVTLNTSNVTQIISNLINNPYFWLSIVIFVLSAIFWLLGIKKVPLSNAYAITSLNYIFVSVYAVSFLNELLSFQKVVAIVLVILGVYLMALGSKKASLKIKTF